VKTSTIYNITIFISEEEKIKNSMGILSRSEILKLEVDSIAKNDFINTFVLIYIPFLITIIIIQNLICRIRLIYKVFKDRDQKEQMKDSFD